MNGRSTINRRFSLIIINIFFFLSAVCITGCKGFSDVNPAADTSPVVTISSQYSQNEVIILMRDYLLNWTRTQLAKDIVQTKMSVLHASFLGDGLWEISGEGTWRLYETTGKIEPRDEAALRVLQSIVDANQVASSGIYAVSKITSSVVRVVTQSEVGSGVIISADGYILTNNHVVQDTLLVTVCLAGGETYTGTVTGRDEIRDIAVIKIAASGLSAATLGNSDNLLAGEKVISMSYPVSLSGTVTATEGVISAFYTQKSTAVHSIQTDAAMNPGSSGGPLINLSGEVVGINSWVVKVSNGTLIEGANFALTINDVKEVLPLLMAGESILVPVVDSWKSFTNKAYTYSISYPDSWTVDDQNMKYVRIRNSTSKMGVDIATITNISAQSTVEDFVKTNIQQLQSDKPDFQLIYQKEVNYGGYSGIEIAYVYTEGSKWYFQHFFTQAGNSIYHIRVWVEESQYNINSAKIDTILDSFHL